MAFGRAASALRAGASPPLPAHSTRALPGAAARPSDPFPARPELSMAGLQLRLLQDRPGPGAGHQGAAVIPTLLAELGETSPEVTWG